LGGKDENENIARRNSGDENPQRSIFDFENEEMLPRRKKRERSMTY
jgi:hypothetical protein